VLHFLKRWVTTILALHFTLVIWVEIRKPLKKTPEEYFNRAKVCVYGKIEMYKNRPQIVISNANQIQEQILDR